jgi:aminocarboxymuconate-semialdehyde decarboxylase
MRIDFHSHYYPKRYIKALDEFRFRTRAENKRIYLPRTHELMWDVEKRLDNMRKLSVEKQVLSLANPWTDIFETKRAIELASAVNKEIADIVLKYQNHFIGLGTLPLKSVEGAISEAEKIKDLGLKGVCVGTRVGKRPLSHIYFRPVLKKLEALDLVVFMHPTAPPYVDGMNKYGLIPTIGFPSETTLQLAMLAFSGVLRDLKNLKLVTAHLGGTIPYLIERINASSQGFYYTRFNPVKESGPELPESPGDYLKRIYVDAIAYSTPALECAIKMLGCGRLLFGTDYPLTMGSPQKIIQSIERLSLHKEEMDQIFGSNASRLLGL